MNGPDRELLDSIRHWANHEEKIRRVWLLEPAGDETGGEGDHSIAVELDPVHDSDEEMLLWVSKSGEWQSSLREMAPAIRLEWMNPYSGAGAAREDPDASRSLVYDRVGGLPTR